MIASARKVFEIQKEMETFMLAKEFGVTPNQLKEEPMIDLNKWKQILAAINDAKAQQM